MTKLYDSARRVKSARFFAAGLTRHRPERRAPYSAADLRWWAENSPSNAEGYEVVDLTPEAWDHAAGCALAQDRMDRGLPPF